MTPPGRLAQLQLRFDYRRRERQRGEAVSSSPPHSGAKRGVGAPRGPLGSSLGTITLTRSAKAAGSCREHKMLLISAGCDFFHLQAL